MSDSHNQQRNAQTESGKEKERSVSSTSGQSGEQFSLSAEQDDDIRASLLAGGYLDQQDDHHRDSDQQQQLAATPSITTSTSDPPRDEIKPSLSISSLKFKSPKTWVSNLKSTVAAVSNLATTTTTTSTSSPFSNLRPRSNSTQSLSETREPVSSLVLSPSKPTRYFTSIKSTSSTSSNPYYNPKSKANKSEPNLGLSDNNDLSISSGSERFKSHSDSPRLLVRNLDQAPRGTWTPQISNFEKSSSTSSSSSVPRLPKDRSGKLDAYGQRKMTNPWGLIEIPVGKDDDDEREAEEVERSVSASKKGERAQSRWIVFLLRETDSCIYLSHCYCSFLKAPTRSSFR